MLLHDDLGMTELAALREAEFRSYEASAGDAFEAYWAGSPSASVLRDYAAGRETDTHVTRCARRDQR